MLKKKSHQQHSSANRSDIIEAKKEQLKTLIKKYKKPLILLTIGIVILLIICISYKAYNRALEEKYSTILQQVLIDTEKGNNAKAKEALKNLYENRSVPDGVRSLASLKYAAVLFNEDKVDDAVNIYIEINKTKKFDPYIKELAGLLALKSMIDANSSIFDDKITTLITDLEKNSKTLKYYIIEQKGIFEWSRGRDENAVKIFQGLVDNPDVSGTVRNRAKEMVEIASKKESLISKEESKSKDNSKKGKTK